MNEKVNNLFPNFFVSIIVYFTVYKKINQMSQGMLVRVKAKDGQAPLQKLKAPSQGIGDSHHVIP
jgi:hypothetical protein